MTRTRDLLITSGDTVVLNLFVMFKKLLCRNVFSDYPFCIVSYILGTFRKFVRQKSVKSDYPSNTVYHTDQKDARKEGFRPPLLCCLPDHHPQRHQGQEPPPPAAGERVDCFVDGGHALTPFFWA